MNKFIRVTIGSTIFGLMVIMISFYYQFRIGTNLTPVEVRPLWQATMPPPLSISPVFLLSSWLFPARRLRVAKKKIIIIQKF